MMSSGMRVFFIQNERGRWSGKMNSMPWSSAIRSRNIRPRDRVASSSATSMLKRSPLTTTYGSPASQPASTSIAAAITIICQILSVMAEHHSRFSCSALSRIRRFPFPGSAFEHGPERRDVVDRVLGRGFSAAVAGRPADGVFGQLVEEAARRGLDLLAAATATAGVGDLQLALGSGDADVHQAAFFLDGVLIDRAAVRHQALLAAGQPHARELQPLGRV